MFDSGISAAQLIEELKSEIDVAIPIPNSSYVRWLNSLEQLLYSEFIQEQNVIAYDYETGSDRTYYLEDGGRLVDMIGFECERPKACDVFSVYCGDKQLVQTTYEKYHIFPDCYCIYRDKLILVNTEEPYDVKIYFHSRPKLKTAGNFNDLNVMLPIEFIEIAAAKLRGEAYKLANEDVLAAKWLNDYNILLENFKVWLKSREVNLGI